MAWKVYADIYDDRAGRRQVEVGTAHTPDGETFWLTIYALPVAPEKGRYHLVLQEEPAVPDVKS